MKALTTVVFSLLLGLGGAPAEADAGNGTDDVWSLLEAQDQASGRFLQELYGEEGELLETSRGTYAMLRPGYFRWEIEYPDRQLIVVADDILWHYDLDLASATRRSTSDEESFSALELLAGERVELERRFEVQSLGPSRYRLVPIFPGAAFAAVELSLNGAEIVAMDISDRSGQQIRLALEPTPHGKNLDADDFRFDPPLGVEVYDATQP